MMRFDLRRRHALARHVSRFLLAMVLCSGPAAAEDMKLAPGDTIEFSVTGAPDLQRKIPIGTDGLASFPLVGDISVKDRTLAQLRAEVRALIAQKEYRQHVAGSAKSSLDVIWADQVTLTISEYRPVYINGDVAKPGEQKFKPGLTVRQALSLAGGFDILRFRMDNPFLNAADLRGSYESAWIDYAKEQARLRRLQSELNGRPGPDAAGLGDPPISGKLLGAIRSSESAYQQTDDQNFAKERAHVREMLAATDGDIVALTQRRDTEASGTSFDEVEYKRINELYRTGTLPMTRVADARRIELLSATQALQSQVELDRAKKDREILKRKSVAIEDDRRMTLLEAEQASQVKLAGIKTKIAAIADKLLYVGALKTQLQRGTGGQPDLILFRNNEQGRKVEEDTALQPGDTVEVALKADTPEGSVAR